MSSSTTSSSTSTDTPHQPKSQPRTQPTLSNSGKPLPDVGAKWGRTPKPSSSQSSSNKDTTTNTDTNDKPDFTTYFTPEEQAALRAKGINPTLKAEMDWSRKRSEGKGFWGKVAGTAMGGGWIK